MSPCSASIHAHLPRHRVGHPHLWRECAYVGMELQILDNEAPVYRLQPYQYHGSVYGVIPAKRGYLKPVGEWNYKSANGDRITVILNGTTILDGDIREASRMGPWIL